MKILKLEFDADTSTRFNRLVQRTGGVEIETVRKALALLEMHTDLERHGGHFQTIHADGEEERLVIK